MGESNLLNHWNPHATSDIGDFILPAFFMDYSRFVYLVGTDKTGAFLF